ncbi:FG-GAP-like repeat-containing protein [Chitinimonas sp. PSY-7]|uniref:FG-GAP-like repeat-containing protein n=1 Tax=Chitinimonas sp. PSY-7 TaxID=3459088 RepID=UPI00403FE46B
MAFAHSADWPSQHLTPRFLANVNGDGKADLIGFGRDGVYVARGTSMTLALLRPHREQSDVITRHSYDAAGRQRYSINALGEVTEKQYDAAGRLIRTTQYAKAIPNPQITQVELEALLRSDPYAKDTANRSTHTLYDSANRISGEIDAEGYLTEYTYDGVGNRTQSTRYTHRVWSHGGNGLFNTPERWDAILGQNAGGWQNQESFPRLVGDINGDGRADLVGIGSDSLFTFIANENNLFGIGPTGTQMRAESGWTSQNIMPRALADMNGDGRADLVGFGTDGVYVALAQGNGTHFTGFGLATRWLQNMGRDAGGWINQDTYPRLVADVNGDGKADIVGFSAEGATTYLSTGSGLTHVHTSPQFMRSTGWTSQTERPRALADMNGDGKADIVGFAADGVYVSLAQGSGTQFTGFGAMTQWLSGMGTHAGGWSSQDLYPRLLGDVNGDGKADLVGMGHGGTSVYLSSGSGFPSGSTEMAFAHSADWPSQHLTPRFLANVNGDGKADLIGFGRDGVYVARSTSMTLAMLRPHREQSDLTTQYVYDAKGRQTFSSDANGVVTEQRYDSMGRVIETIRYAKPVDNSQPLAISIKQSLTRSTGDLCTQYTYDALGRKLTETIDPTGLKLTTRFEYDAMGNMVAKWDAKDNATRFVYDTSGRQTFSCDANGVVTEQRYNSLGQIAESIRYAKPVDTSRPMAESIKQSLASSAGDLRTQYTYDALGRKLTETTDAVDIRTSPDAAPQRVQLVTRFDYDSMGNLVKRTEAAGIAGMERVSEFAYDRAGRQTTLKQVGFGTVGSTPEVVNDTIYNGTDLNRTSLGDTPFTPTSTTYYDSFGNAVAHEDVGGNWRYKSYDKLGRIILETDGEGYLTAYNYDAIGNRTSLVRHATKLDLAPGRKEGYDLNQERSALLLPDRASPYDRAILYRYDQAGRVIETVEPTAYQLNLQGNLVEASATGKTTRNQYNAQGLLIKQSVLVSHVGTTQTWADTTFYYDAAGRKVGQVDAEGYVTQWTYNSLGKMTREVQYAASLPVDIADLGNNLDHSELEFEFLVDSLEGQANLVTGANRSTRYEYDKLGNRTAEIRENIGGAIVNAQGGVSYTNADVATRSRYDQYGNVIETTDARGNRVFNYYDALGRMSHQAQASQRVGNTDHYIVTQYERDAHGNAVRTTRFADTMTLAVGAERPGSLAVPASSNDDRVEQRRFDLAGHQTEYRVDLRAEDGVLGNQILQKTFYDKFGRTALEWQGVRNTYLQPGNLVSNNQVKAFDYDRNGNQVGTRERYGAKGESTEVKHTQASYNAFGEITERKLKDITTGVFEYDNAGRIWRRQEAGVWTVQYYNPMGWEVARITSPVDGALSGAITPASLAHTAVLSGNQLQTGANAQYRRTYTHYDKLGRQISQTGPAFTTQPVGEVTSSITVGKQDADPTITEIQLPIQTDGSQTWLRYTKHGKVYVVERGSPPMLNFNLYQNISLAVNVNDFSLNDGESIQLQQVSLLVGDKLTPETDEKDLFNRAVGITHYRLSRVNGVYTLNAEASITPTEYQPVTQARFDRWGNRISLTDAAGAIARWQYNNQNQLQLETGTAVNQVVDGVSTRGTLSKRYSYSHTGDLLGSWDGNGNLTRQQFDQFGRLLTTRYSASETNLVQGLVGDTNTYDTQGRLAQTISNIGDKPLTTTYTYNRLDQRIKVRRQGETNTVDTTNKGNNRDTNQPNWVSKALVTDFTYDAAGNQINEARYDDSAAAHKQETRYRFDTQGKVTESGVFLFRGTPNNSLSDGLFQTTRYDLLGNKVRESNQWGSDPAETKTWQYDLGTGRLMGHTDLGGNTYGNYQYDGAGMLSRYDYTRINSGLAPITRSHVYDTAGHLIEQTELQNKTVSVFDIPGLPNNGGLIGTQKMRYDKLGRISFELMSRPNKGEWFQATDYDALGRVQGVYGQRVGARYGYDGNNNRTLVTGSVGNASWLNPVSGSNYHYRYDALNRVIVSRGVFENGKVGISKVQGEMIAYFGASQQRMGVESYRSYTDSLTTFDSFKYDSFGQLIEVSQRSATGSNVLIKTRREHNYLGQVTTEDSYSNEGGISQRTRNEFNAQGRLRVQTTKGVTGAGLTEGAAKTTLTNTYLGSRLTSYQFIDHINSAQSQTFAFQHQAFETWRETSQTRGAAVGQGTSMSTLDHYGNTTKVSEAYVTQRTMLVDFNGRVLRKTNLTRPSVPPNTNQVNYLYAGGNTVASSYGAGENANFDYTSAARTGTQAPSNLSIYPVNKGDTLRTIAFAMWGDSSLWYLIGDENGLTQGADAPLDAGKSLRIPNAVSAANRADTFAPYNPSRLVGDTTPGLPPPPPPPKKKRWGLGTILMVAVAIAVTVYTAGAATPMLQGAFAAAGMSAATAAVAGTVAGAALGGAVGSLASQGTGLITGTIDEFSWSQVGRSALSNGLTAGIGGSGLREAAQGLNWGSTATSALTAVGSTALSQGFMSVVGASPFSWRTIAAAGIAAPIADSIGNNIFGVEGTSVGMSWAKDHHFAANYLNNLAGGIVNRTAQIAVNGRGRLDFASVAANAFGDVLGNSIAGNGRNWVGRTPSPTTASGIPVSPVGRSAPGNAGPENDYEVGSTGTGGFAYNADVEVRQLPYEPPLEVRRIGPPSEGWLPSGEIDHAYISRQSMLNQHKDGFVDGMKSVNRDFYANQKNAGLDRGGFLGTAQYMGAHFGGLTATAGTNMAEGVGALYTLATDQNARNNFVSAMSNLTVDGVVGSARTGLRNFSQLPLGQQAEFAYTTALEGLAGGGLAKAGGFAGNAGKQFLVNNAASMMDDIAQRGIPVLPFPNAPRMPMAAYAVPVDDAASFGMRASDSGLALPTGRTAAEIRNMAGRASGGLNLPEVNGTWLKGTHGNFGNIPGQVADKLNGKTFDSFNDFRNAFWTEVAADRHLASQFGKANLRRMEQGMAPIAPSSQHLGKQSSYVLHHKLPIQHGGSVYDMSNLAVVTPKLHKEILDGAFHFGGKR